MTRAIPHTSELQVQGPSALLNLYNQTRQRTLQLIAGLSAEDCALQSMPDASPVKWHLAHTTWFFETFILETSPGYVCANPAYRVLFNSYYHAVGDRHPRPERGLISRPGLNEVLQYRAHVDAAMTQLLAIEPTTIDSSLVELGINHEEQHQELMLTDLKHLLWKNPLRPAYQAQWPLTALEARKPIWVAFPEGVHEMGHIGSNFAFDNETPRHREYSQAFELRSHPVTHGDFLAFIADDGYRRPELWLSMGWDAVVQNGWEAPLYWERGENEQDWRTFTLHGIAPIDANTPVCHLSYFEADAYARWANARLPTELEWEIAASTANIEGNFLDSSAYHPLALCQPPDATGLAQLFGDVWEWTQSDYAAYPGFRPTPGAVGEYNGKFMCGQYVLRGGSCATPRRHIRSTYRNFFPPAARWQFSGLRLARDLS